MQSDVFSESVKALEHGHNMTDRKSRKHSVAFWTSCSVLYLRCMSLQKRSMKINDMKIK